MKAFLLAAGYGTRLRPLTDQIPKCLLPIGGVPLLGIWLDLFRTYGISEVLINAHSHSNAVKDYISKNSGGLSIRLSEEETLLGSAGTLRENRSWIGADPLFGVFYADVLTNVNLNQMLEFHRLHKQAATMGVYEVSNPRECGIVTLDQDGIVRQFVEKPSNPQSNLAFAGLLLATTAVLDVIPDQTPVDIGFDVLPKLVDRMAAYAVPDYIVDIGTPQKYDFVQTTWPGLPARIRPESCPE